MITQAQIESAAPAIAEILQRYFEYQWQEILREIQSHGYHADVNLSHWTEPMAEALEPVLVQLWLQGAQQTQERLERANGGRVDRTEGVTAGPGRTRRSVGRYEAAEDRREHSATGGIAVGGRRGGRRKELIDLSSFDVFNPRILEAIRHAALDFCQSTNDTSTMRLELAIEELRAGLGAGLQAGESIAQLTGRVQNIFADPGRAARIANSEASRSMHEGQYNQAMESSEVRGLKWLASADCCQLCERLAGKEVEFEEPFYNDGRGTVYSAIYHPPAHPNCMCSVTEVLR